MDGGVYSRVEASSAVGRQVAGPAQVSDSRSVARYRCPPGVGRGTGLWPVQVVVWPRYRAVSDRPRRHDTQREAIGRYWRSWRSFQRYAGRSFFISGGCGHIENEAGGSGTDWLCVWVRESP